MTVAFLGKFGKKPMHFFGALGTLMFFIGALLALYLGIDKLFFHKSAQLLASRTAFLLALVAMIIGVQFFMTGFIAEIMGRNSSSRNNYLIQEKIAC
jgi:hypothetical protein